MGPCEHRYIYTGAHARAEKFAENLEDDAGGAYNTNIPSKAGLQYTVCPVTAKKFIWQ